MQFLLNTKRHVVHDSPADERCNLDAIRKAGHAQAEDNPQYVAHLIDREGWRRCRRCRLESLPG